MFNKKILSHIVLSFLLISASTVTVSNPDIIKNQLIYDSNISIVTPCAEETEWVYRFVDGQYQKRLWSITYEKWLTDWIVV